MRGSWHRTLGECPTRDARRLACRAKACPLRWRWLPPGTCLRPRKLGEWKLARRLAGGIRYVSRALTPYHLLSCCSFKTAWVSYEEHDTMASLWGEPDIVAKDLDDCARQIIERETQLARG